MLDLPILDGEAPIFDRNRQCFDKADPLDLNPNYTHGRHVREM